MKLAIYSFLFILFVANTVRINAQEVVKKPLNVVWISCEDIGPIIGAYGVDQIKTPNIDKLAA
ncbi:MAG: hypothetical protein QMC18_01245, partial [Polaribacter sp.]